MVYTYRARLERLVDGDTLVLTLDLGYGIQQTSQRVRLKGVDTAETFFVRKDSDEYARGVVHRDFTEHWLAEAEQSGDGDSAEGWPFVFDSQRWEIDPYQRAVGYITRQSDGEELTQALYDEFGDEVRWVP